MPAGVIGLDRVPARAKVVEALGALGLLLEVKRAQDAGAARRPHRGRHRADADRPVVRRHEQAGRGRQVDHRQGARGRGLGRDQLLPENWVNTYNQWLNNIQDWCISRQLWWGHRIPAWYDEEGRIYVATCEEGRSAPGRPTCSAASTPSPPRCRRASAKARPPSSTRDRRSASPAPRPPRRRPPAPGRRRARHLVLVRAVAVLHARLDRQVAGEEQRRARPLPAPPPCSSPASTSSSSGSPAW